MSKIVVIGGNHAGTAAINTITDNYPDHEIVVFERNSNISFLGCGMALWIGGQIDGPEKLFYASQEDFEKKGVTVHMETEVTSVNFAKKVLQAQKKDGTTFGESYDKLIMATGSLPWIPEVPGGKLENIHKVKLYQDAQTVIDKLGLSEIRHIAVIGSGYIGVELAEAFQRKGKEVTLIDIADTCLASYYDEPFTKMMEDNLQNHGINLMFHTKVEGFEGENKVEKVLTTKGSVQADMVIWAVGFNPNNELGKGTLELFSNGAYLVNKKQETSHQDVYAVGDCATLWDNAADRTNYIALATNAVRSGIVAAHNVCGTELVFPGVQGSNAISIYGLNMVSTGLTQKDALNEGIEATHTDFEDYQRALFMRTNEKVKIRIVFEKTSRRIIGAQLASQYDISMAIHMFSLAIEKRVTIDELKLLDIFFLPHFNQPYNYITMAALGAPNT